MSTERDDSPCVGVVAMQGAFAEHVDAVHRCGAAAVQVRTARQLETCDAVILPGGESTAIRRALVRCGMYDALFDAVESGTPVLGTCAGLIVLARAEPDGAPPTFGLLDVEVLRNGFGRQVGSSERIVSYRDRAGAGVFIRAPRIATIGPDVEVVARIGAGELDAGEPVAVRQGNILGVTFHPELTADTTLHQLLLDMAAATPGRVEREPSVRG